MLLSDFFPEPQVIRDGPFRQLDQCDTTIPDSLVFCQTADYLQKVQSNQNISAIITTPELAKSSFVTPCVIAENPYLAFFEIYQRLFEVESAWCQINSGIGTNCSIHPSAIISDKAFIGNDVTIGPHVVVGDYVSIGERAFIDSGVVLGAEGMMPLTNAQGKRTRVPHRGGVNIGSDVVILSNSVVVRSIYQQPTSIGNATQIGILTTVGHGAQVAENCIIRGHCLIAGRVSIDADAVISISSVIREGCKIGAGAEVKMGSVVVKDVSANEAVSGNFAMPHRKHVASFLRNQS